jgi:hypothetical protein
MIEGRVLHKASNAMKTTFSAGPGDPLGIAVQGAGDGKRSKLGMLFGFKNGGAGKHLLTYADGTALGIESKVNAPSVCTRNGSQFATVERGDAIGDIYIWWDKAGGSLPVPILGARLGLLETPTPLQRDVLMCVRVEIAIRLRPYFKAMGDH